MQCHQYADDIQNIFPSSTDSAVAVNSVLYWMRTRLNLDKKNGNWLVGVQDVQGLACAGLACFECNYTVSE